MDSNRTEYSFACTCSGFVVRRTYWGRLRISFCSSNRKGNTGKNRRNEGEEHEEKHGIQLRPFGRGLKDWLKPEKKKFLKSEKKFRSQSGRKLRERFPQKRKKRKQKKRKFFASGVAVVKINNRFGCWMRDQLDKSALSV